LWGYPETATAIHRYPAKDRGAEHGKIIDIAQARRRFGYRRIHDLLRPEFPG
jgi:putative transposase